MCLIHDVVRFCDYISCMPSELVYGWQNNSYKTLFRAMRFHHKTSMRMSSIFVTMGNWGIFWYIESAHMPYRIKGKQTHTHQIQMHMSMRTGTQNVRLMYLLAFAPKHNPWSCFHPYRRMNKNHRNGMESFTWSEEGTNGNIALRKTNVWWPKKPCVCVHRVWYIVLE